MMKVGILKEGRLASSEEDYTPQRTQPSVEAGRN
jgi:hypothetical protein